jgi:AcrR family transcriptional regulator
MPPMLSTFRPALAKPAPQPRGQAAVERLLDAAEAILTRSGLERATVPAIARRARMSVGNVYKRFPDKDALMRAVYQRFFARSLEQNREVLTSERWASVPIREMLQAIVHGIVDGYREHRALIRALLLYAETHPDPGFRREAETLRRETMARLEQLLAARGSELMHPAPERAIRLAVAVIALALQSVVLSDRCGPAEMITLSPGTAAELSAMVAGYLGLK